ncbi:MAG: protein serine/threonine phosphatase [Bacteroidetes bacterium]|nr:MAG: protein serine/threonine phosphatase [Bacteroidota bacterium]
MKQAQALEEEYSRSDDPIVKCELLRQLFRSVVHVDISKATYYSDEMERLGRENRCGKCIAEWNLARGLLFEKKSDYDGAMEHLMAALPIFQSLEDQHGIASVMINVGQIFFFRKEFGKAEEHYNEALRIGLLSDNKYIISRAYGSLSNVYTTREQFDKAFAHYARALKILKEMKDMVTYGRVLDNVGILYRVTGQHKKAARYHLRSYKIKLELGDKENCARSLGNLGNLYTEMGEHRKAIGYFNKAIELAGEQQTTEIIKACYGSMSEVYARMGDYKNAFFCQQHYGRLKDEIVNEKSVHLYAEADARLKAAAQAFDVKTGVYKDLYEKSRDQQMPAGLETLSKREMETLAYLAKGLTDKEIAEGLYLSVSTVKTHLRSIYQKLSMKSRSEVIALVYQHKLFG